MTDHNDKATVGRRRTSELDGVCRSVECSPDEPLFMPEEHAVAVSRNADHPIQPAIDLLKALAGGAQLCDVSAISAKAISERLQAYADDQQNAFRQLQARLDLAERAHAKFIDEVAEAIDLCEVPEDQKETPEWVLRELHSFVSKKPAGFSREAVLDTVDSLAKEHNVTEITESVKKTPLRALRTLVETIAKRKSPTALRTELDSVEGQLECLTAALRHIGRGVGACEWALAADDRAAVNDIVKGFDTLVGQKQEAEAQQAVAEQETKALLNDCRALVQEFDAGLVDHPLPALRELLETLTKNQKPENMDANLQTVITANARLNATLQAIEAVINTAKV